MKRTSHKSLGPYGTFSAALAQIASDPRISDAEADCHLREALFLSSSLHVPDPARVIATVGRPRCRRPGPLIQDAQT